VTVAELRILQRRGTIALAAREARRVLSLWTQTILPPVLTGALFLAVFGGALGKRIHNVEGLPYVSFILPGLLVMTVAGQSFANCSTSLFQQRTRGVLFAALGVITGVWAETFDQHAFVANVVITPLALVGGVFYSARSLAQPWESLTRFDPLYYLVDAARAGLAGAHESSAALSVAIVAATALAAFLIASDLVARGWRIKP
jgi:ABC-2 type transport system permease protein